MKQPIHRGVVVLGDHAARQGGESIGMVRRGNSPGGLRQQEFGKLQLPSAQAADDAVAHHVRRGSARSEQPGCCGFSGIVGNGAERQRQLQLHRRIRVGEQLQQQGHCRGPRRGNQQRFG